MFILFMLTFGLLTLLYAVDDVVIKTSTESGTNSVSITNSTGTKTAIKATSSGNVIHSANSYLNFGPTEGITGYGIRDSSGTIKYKNTGNPSWSSMFPPTYAQITYTHGGGTFDSGTGYYANQTTLSLGTIVGTYSNAFEKCTGTSSYYMSRSENLTITPISERPAIITIVNPGLYMVSANVAICGNLPNTTTAAVEFEVGLNGFDQNEDNYFFEALSCVVATQKNANDHASGAMTGYLNCEANDTIQLGFRKLNGTELNFKVYSINLVVQRVK